MKILHMTSSLDGGGVERLLYDYYCHMDRSNLQFDFVKVESPEGIMEQMLREMGCRIFSVPPIREDSKRYTAVLRDILRQGNYDVIHCHGGFRSVAALRLAKQAGVPVRIVHSHAAREPEGFSRKAVRIAATLLAKYYATSLFACGIDAGEWMWGAKSVERGKVYIMHNAINTKQFEFNPEKRTALRMQLGIEDKYVIGNVARLSYQKNHEFLLDAFSEVHRQRPDAILLLIGGGELENELRAQVSRLGIDECVRFMGVRKDVPDLLNAMDLFVLPSRWEGLPVTAVEVQANGLKALLSDRITKEISICKGTEYLPLVGSSWVDAIVSAKSGRNENCAEEVADAGYDIEREAVKLLMRYLVLRQHHGAIVETIK